MKVPCQGLLPAAAICRPLCRPGAGTAVKPLIRSWGVLQIAPPDKPHQPTRCTSQWAAGPAAAAAGWWPKSGGSQRSRGWRTGHSGVQQLARGGAACGCACPYPAGNGRQGPGFAAEVMRRVRTGAGECGECGGPPVAGKPGQPRTAQGSAHALGLRHGFPPQPHPLADCRTQPTAPSLATAPGTHLRVAAPQQEHHSLSPRRQLRNHGISEPLPPLLGV